MDTPRDFGAQLYFAQSIAVCVRLAINRKQRIACELAPRDFGEASAWAIAVGEVELDDGRVRSATFGRRWACGFRAERGCVLSGVSAAEPLIAERRAHSPDGRGRSGAFGLSSYGGAVLFDARFRKRRKIHVAHHVARSAAACDIPFGQKLRVGVFYGVSRYVQAFGELANGHELLARLKRVLGDVAPNGIVNLQVKWVSRVLVKRNHRRHPLAD